MHIKKNQIFTFIFLALILISFLSFIKPISAKNTFLEKISRGGEPILTWLFGNVSGNSSLGEFLVFKLLFFFLLLTITCVAVKRVPHFGENNFIVGVISVIVSILATRYLATTSLINFIWLQYGVLGILITSILPFTIFFFFIESFSSSLIRRIGWLAYAGIFFALAYVRWEDFAVDSSKLNYGYIYIFVAVIALGLLIWDKAIHSVITYRGISKISDSHTKIQIMELRHDIDELKKKILKTEDRAERENIMKQIKNKKYQIKALLNS